MSSVYPEDRTTKARIRDAAVHCLADNGPADTTVRAIAQAAGVSPALVIHHYGSMDHLRAVCDEHVVSIIRTTKSDAMARGTSMDPLAAFRGIADGPPVMKYIAKTITDGSPHVTQLIREMVEDAVVYMKAGQASGLLQEIDDPRGCAAVMTFWSLGALVLHDQLRAVLGVDLLGDSVPDDPAALGAYYLPAMELLSGGLVTSETYHQFKHAFTPDKEPTT